jgi:CP family cyanate transporter-like MFS transporter
MAEYSDDRFEGEPESDDSASRAAWLLLGAVWLITFFVFILFQCVSPLLPVLLAEFHLNHWMGGFLYSLPVVMIAIFSYPLGALSDRIPLGVAVGCGATVAILSSLLRSLATDYSTLAILTAVFGLGLAMCFINLPRLVKTLFPKRLIGTVTGIYTAAIPLGVGLGIALTKPLFSMTGGWREVMVVWSLMAIPVLVFWWIVARLAKDVSKGLLHKASGREEHLSETRVSEPTSTDQVLRSVLICGLLLSLLNLAFYATIGWLPTYLTEEGWDGTKAAAATSLISFPEIPGVILFPLISDRTGKGRTILVAGFLVIALGSAGLALYMGATWFVTPVLGVVFGGTFALLLAMPAQLVERRKVASAAGAVISIGYVGALAGPLIAGYIRDLTGSFSMAFLIVAVTGLISAALSLRAPKSP